MTACCILSQYLAVGVGEIEFSDGQGMKICYRSDKHCDIKVMYSILLYICIVMQYQLIVAWA